MRHRRTRTTLLAAAATTLAIGATGASAAHAGTSLFCPNTYEGDFRLVAANGGTCVSGGFSTLRAVRFVAAASGYEHCAVGKADADGGGANTTNAACGTAIWQTTACYASHAGYAKGINREPSRHSYQGLAWWGASCP